MRFPPAKSVARALARPSPTALLVLVLVLVLAAVAAALAAVGQVRLGAARASAESGAGSGAGLGAGGAGEHFVDAAAVVEPVAVEPVAGVEPVAVEAAAVVEEVAVAKPAAVVESVAGSEVRGYGEALLAAERVQGKGRLGAVSGARIGGVAVGGAVDSGVVAPPSVAAASDAPAGVVAEVSAPTAAAAAAVPAPPAFVEKVYKGIFYLKTHKSGSSAVRAALRAYSIRNNLRFKLDVPGHIFINSPAANMSVSSVDAFFTHHASFDNRMLATYLGSAPSFVLTSLRLPLQRQLSWFRQQNRKWDERLGLDGGRNCSTGAVTEMLGVFDEWIVDKRSASQWRTLQERGERLASDRMQNNVTAIAEQFDFIFLKERLAESMECLCVQTGMRLCGKETPLRSINAKPADSCVEASLIRYRSDKLLLNSTKDLVLYEKVNNKITACQRNGIPEECWCAEEW